MKPIEVLMGILIVTVLVLLLVAPVGILLFMEPQTAAYLLVYGTASLFLICPLLVACTHHP